MFNESLAKSWDKKFQEDGEKLAEKLNRLAILVKDLGDDEPLQIIKEIAEWGECYVFRVPYKGNPNVS